ncbi:MAG TPA: amidohydrolase family protein [Candidatus Baltobacteraceae bacterium]|nr:amidohydrolase family protein [Candidatus Baltobacteraceae bacterium]
MISTVLENAAIVDGMGHFAYTTDIGIAGDRIALIGDLRERDALVRIDCSGKTIAPGFIDTHSHSDELWLTLPRCDGKIAQGVTTEIGGNCGTSVPPLEIDDFFHDVERNGVALNVATLVGLGTTRRMIAGEDPRRLEREEIEAQARIVRQACEQGAIGVSSGLIYPPSMYADTHELAAMAAAAREANAPRYATHMRSESDELLAAVDEAIEIGQRAQVLVQCSHHKAAGKKNWGKVHQSLERIDRARRHDTAVYCDVYPYVASWTELATILPAQVRHGGVDATLERLSDPESATAIALALQLKHADEWHDMLITEAASAKNAQLAGMRMDEIARAWRLSPAAAAIRLLREERLDVGAMFFKMCEDDVATVLSADFCCIGSDASIRALDGPTARGVPHPRTFGTFPRVFGRFVRGRQTLDLVEAVRRMTALPASIFGLRERGTIAAGNYADLVVFDANAIRDTATYEAPYQFPIGIEHVFVSGRAVLLHGTFTNERPGRVLRGGA